MASAAQIAARPKLPTLPDGTYAVPDPDDPDTLTLWKVTAGSLDAWPPRRRWAPRMPPPPAGLSPGERREHRERWYAAVYWPWKVAVAASIADDPGRAADRFRDAVPAEEKPDAVLRRALAELGFPYGADARSYAEQCAQEQRERVDAARTMVAAGFSLSTVGRLLRVSKSTVWHWARDGRHDAGQPVTAESVAAALVVLEREAADAEEQAETDAAVAADAEPDVDVAALLAAVMELVDVDVDV
ncbi:MULTISPECIES: hypothetical protein [unclassified Streptomyces]|uniref:hypothetical protein n=1 Tax=unclassified Streptomyces TaxID=2593676 RepID=UPI000DADFB2D|nr:MULTISPECIES: hypothetical protein [unclassified Streptomyces]PZT74492.1 hypothetical protein DNK55_20535 [Streptomyces sp. AC1-42T]PZT82522.1 hypothetical protein DNK56_10910 [Streptomyces sp. AC1-42W]